VKVVAIACVTGLVMLLAGVGIGYALNAGTRKDLSAAQAKFSTAQAQLTTAEAKIESLTAAQATGASSKVACTNAATKSAALLAQWQNMANDITNWAYTKVGSSEEAAIESHMKAQLKSMETQQAQIDTLMGQCTAVSS
jgi:hypothetical protein